MTGTTTIDLYFNNNYNELKKHCELYNIDEDRINNVYLKMRRLTYLTGLTESQMYSYVKRSIWNHMLDDKKKLNRRGGYLSLEEINLNKIEGKLTDDHLSDQEYINEIQWLTRMLFKYIDRRGIFSDREVFILKTYAWTTKSYSELEKEIGISKDICKNTMRKFRNDLRNNFIIWLKEQNDE